MPGYTADGYGVVLKPPRHPPHVIIKTCPNSEFIKLKNISRAPSKKVPDLEFTSCDYAKQRAPCDVHVPSDLLTNRPTVCPLSLSQNVNNFVLLLTKTLDFCPFIYPRSQIKTTDNQDANNVLFMWLTIYL